jgi:hypothetical protein
MAPERLTDGQIGSQIGAGQHRDTCRFRGPITELIQVDRNVSEIHRPRAVALEQHQTLAYWCAKPTAIFKQSQR